MPVGPVAITVTIVVSVAAMKGHHQILQTLYNRKVQIQYLTQYEVVLHIKGVTFNQADTK